LSVAHNETRAKISLKNVTKIFEQKKCSKKMFEQQTLEQKIEQKIFEQQTFEKNSKNGRLKFGQRLSIKNPGSGGRGTFFPRITISPTPHASAN
jgi:hypothetical protein